MEVHRKLDLPVMTFDMAAEIAAMKASEQWAATRRGAKTLVKNDELRIVLVGLSTGLEMHEHHVEGAMSVAVISGAISFKTDGAECALRAGQLLALAAARPHQVEALEDSVFVLTVAQP